MEDKKNKKQEKNLIKKMRRFTQNNLLYAFINFLRLFFYFYAIVFFCSLTIILSYDITYKKILNFLYVIIFRSPLSNLYLNIVYYCIAIMMSIILGLIVLKFARKYNEKRKYNETKKLAWSMIIFSLIFMIIPFVLWGVLKFANYTDLNNFKNFSSFQLAFYGSINSLKDNLKLNSIYFIFLQILNFIILLFGVWTFIEYRKIKKNIINYFNGDMFEKIKIKDLSEAIFDDKIEFGVHINKKEINEVLQEKFNNEWNKKIDEIKNKEVMNKKAKYMKRNKINTSQIELNNNNEKISDIRENLINDELKTKEQKDDDFDFIST